MVKSTKIPENATSRLIMLVLIMLTFISKSDAQTVTPWMTSADQSRLLQQQGNVSFGGNSGNNSSTITLNAGNTYQTMDGFGFTLTQGSCELISAMDGTQQNQLLNDLYNPNTGINAGVMRISIGASDLSSSNYSYNESSGDVNMNNFSLNGPDLNYLIPMIKKIKNINPNIKILATPWSPPRWMKTNNSWVGGNLQTQYYAAYAKYFVKYFDAMKAQGISIWGITPQNEPENPYNNPSLSMNSSEQKNFINSQLGPQMASAGYGGIKIIAFDHNCDNPNYAIDVLNNSNYAEGAAFHLYKGDISALSTVHNATNKNVYFTEQYTGSLNSFNDDFGWHIQNVIIGSANNWAKVALEWNVANNPNMGPHTDGGCDTCLGAITVNNNTSYTKNVAFYIIGQISKFVKPGAVRIGSSSSNGTVMSSAFKNPDGSIALVVYNSGSSNKIRVVNGSSAFDYNIPGSTAVTFNWGATSNVNVTGVSVNPTTASVAVNNTKQLSATVSPNNATNQNVNWSSSNSAIANVNASGLVTGVSAGTATITATTQDGNKTATAAITVTGTAVQSPYGGSAATIPGVIQAENYDLGGQNVAYNDADVANQGGAYRTTEGVDISSLSGSGYTVGWAADGEWLEYTTNVTAGTYTIDATVASPNSGKQLRVLLDGTVLTTISIPNTGSWDSFQTVSVPKITLPGGNNKVLRLEILGGLFNIDKIEVKSVGSVPVTSVALNPTTASISVGGNTQLTATLSPSNATNKNVTWSSSNTAVATVNASGLVSGVAAGSATITVTTSDGAKTATSVITVTTISSTFPGYYNIISRNSNKGLDVAGYSTSNGANVQQYDIVNGGGNNQRWKFETAGDGNFYIIVKSSLLYLATENNSTADGVNVVQRTASTSNEFKWTVTSLGGGFYKIINLNSGKALDVDGVSTSNGANIHLWTYVGGLNQQWQFVQVETSVTGKGSSSKTLSGENGEETTVSINATNEYLTINTNNKGNGTVELYSIAGLQVLESNVVFEIGNSSKVDISNLPKGIYIVRITNSQGAFSKKIIKQ